MTDLSQTLENGISLKEIQKNQPILNIGTLGHVSHGKSTIVREMSGKRPQQFSAEQVRNITIQLGYANVKIWKCDTCPSPTCYTYSSWKSTSKKCKLCKKEMELALHFSLIDAPGHEAYMSTMLNGTAAMDTSIIVIAANENIPQPQTKEHIIAAELSELSNSIVCLNKCDLVMYNEAKDAYNSTKTFLKGTSYEDSVILPICANFGMNLDLLCQAICERIAIPTRNFDAPPRMVVIRSFDVNKGGDDINLMKGGVAGGTLTQGVLRVGDRIEIRPGLIYGDDEQFTYQPLFTTVGSLYSEQQSLDFAITGGLIGVGTMLDPCFMRSNNLVGQMLGVDLPEVYIELRLKYKLIKEFTSRKQKDFKKDEKILVNIHSSEIEATVIKTEKKRVVVRLSKPVCVEMKSKVSISKRVNGRWRLSGFATIGKGREINKYVKEA